MKDVALFRGQRSFGGDAEVQASKHLVSEKPLATTMEEANALIETAAAQGLTIVCAPPNMLYPYYQEVRRLIGEGTIGRVAFARVRSSNGGPGATWWPNDPTWFYQRGSGPLFDNVFAIHHQLFLDTRTSYP